MIFYGLLSKKSTVGKIKEIVTIKNYNSGIPNQKTEILSLFRQYFFKFKFSIQSAFEVGLINYWNRMSPYFQTSMKMQQPKEEGIKRGLTIKDLTGVFIPFACGLCVAGNA